MNGRKDGDVDVLIHVPRAVLWSAAGAFIMQFIAFVWLIATISANQMSLREDLNNHKAIAAHSSIEARVTRLEALEASRE